MTILYEPVCHGAEHAPFNAAMVTTALAAYPTEPLAFYSEAEHARAVNALLARATARSVSWHTVDVAPRACRSARGRFPYEWRIVSSVLTKAGSSSGHIVACAVTHVGLAALQCQLLTRAPHVRVAVVHHSGLASTLGSRSTQALLRWTALGRIRHVVLGRSILRAVATRMPHATGMRSMRHPYLFPDAAPSASDGQPVRFGFLGLASAEKGFDRFCRIARRVSLAADPDARPRFELIGRLDGASRAGLAALDTDRVVEIASDDGPMARDDYENRVRALTYAVLPYGTDHALASSGAILDAFAHAKPCIALRTPLFEEYFGAMGDIGYLCDSEEEMACVVAALAAGVSPARYAAQQRHIIEGREIFHPRRVARELRSLLD